MKYLVIVISFVPMCGRYVQTADVGEIIKRFRCSKPDFDFVPNSNIAPTVKIPVVMAENKEWKLVQMRWGFLPMWEKEPAKGKPIFNARQDKVATSTFFKGSLANKRCLIPATGFYEWAKVGPKKGPLLFKLKKEDLFAFAGLWKTWKPPEGDVWYTSTIITTEPNKLVGKVHNRMPVILHQKDEEKWLDESVTDLGFLSSLLKPFPADLMEMEEAVIPSRGPRSVKTRGTRKKSTN